MIPKYDSYFYLSVALGAASMGFVVTYPLMKRFTYWPQIILGKLFHYALLINITPYYMCVILHHITSSHITLLQ